MIFIVFNSFLNPSKKEDILFFFIKRCLEATVILLCFINFPFFIYVGLNILSIQLNSLLRMTNVKNYAIFIFVLQKESKN